MTPCECPIAGFCERHKRMKGAHLHKLCSTNQKYYDHWEKISGLQPPQFKLTNRVSPPGKVSKAQFFKSVFAGLRSMASNTSTKPGDSLHYYLDSFGLKITAGCSCTDKIKLMNEWGSAKCLENVNKIAFWLKQEAIVRSLPFNMFLVKQLIKFAINKAMLNEKLASSVDVPSNS